MSARIFVTAVVLALVILANSTYPADPPIMKLRVSLDKADHGSMLRNMGFDEMYITDRFVYLYTDAKGLSTIQQAGIPVEVVHEDVAAYYASQLAEYDGMGGYKTLSEINAYLDATIAAHGDIVSNKISIGQSIEGRDLWAVKISDNPNVDEDEPEVFFHSLIHGNEPVSAHVLYYFMQHLTDNYGTDPEATNLVDNREMWFVLVVNPDGYVYNEMTNPDGGGMWRKNRRLNPDGSYGVNINRNFGYMWGYDDVSSSPIYSDGNYRGEAPFSEPETQAIRDFVTAHDFEIIADCHTPGPCFMWPYSYNMSPTPDENTYMILTDVIDDGVYTSAGHVGPNGCSVDWYYGEQTVKGKSLGICVEVDCANAGMWPDPALLPQICTEFLPIGTFLARAADSLFLADSINILLPPLRAEVPHLPYSQGPDYTVSWSHTDPDNPAVEFELTECQDPVVIGPDPGIDFSNWVTEDFEVSTIDYYSPPSSFRGRVYYSCEIEMVIREPIRVGYFHTLFFWTSYNLEDGFVYLYVQASTDGRNFQSLQGNITTYANPNGYNLGNGITGNSGGWVDAEFDLSAYVGQSIWLRFLCDNNEVSWGTIYIDDIMPGESFDTRTIIASNLTGYDFDFTNKSPGRYYYQINTTDPQGQRSGNSAYGLVVVPDETSFVCGDANSDGVVDQTDVMFLIEYLHKDGPAPVPIEAGDANGDGVVNKDDAKYIIEYLHKDGPLPVCP